MKVGFAYVNVNWKVSNNPYVGLSTNVAVGHIPIPVHILNRPLSLNLTLSNVMVEEDATSKVEDEWDGVLMVVSDAYILGKSLHIPSCIFLG